jgi:hypothetical protein
VFDSKLKLYGYRDLAILQRGKVSGYGFIDNLRATGFSLRGSLSHFLHIRYVKIQSELGLPASFFRQLFRSLKFHTKNSTAYTAVLIYDVLSYKVSDKITDKRTWTLVAERMLEAIP